MNQLLNFRREYSATEFSEENALHDPFQQFKNWLNDAVQSGIEDANAMVLSTAGKDLKPKSRIVLLKNVNSEGLSFFTNYNSNKALQIEENPNVSLLFPWQLLDRQVRIEGTAEKVSPEESDEYFISRPEGSRIGAWASPQSRIIPSRKYLEEIEQELKAKFIARSLPRPLYWGGYRVIPELFEFWQGRSNRLHDRLEYYRNNGNWKIRRLAP
ncbi:MAG: pyridoxamine 5'-phosphate oxidase [Bacteroidales bacterium]|nr:pyridoxamine 5'-phosphate oxidase [Bacteroidales bacterium]